MRLDGHLHLGRIYGRHGKEFYKVALTVEDTLKWIESQQLTHLVCIYIFEDRPLVKELISKTSCKIYPIIWPQNLVDGLGTEEGFDVGIKIHGLRTDHDLTSTRLQNICKLLPDNFILFAHIQGSESPENRNSPLALARLAIKFPRLKFIIGHSGDYGFLSWSAGKNETDKKKILYYDFINENRQQLVISAARFAGKFDNMLCESSVLWANRDEKKSHILKQYASGKWCFGNDMPFCIATCNAGIDKQEKFYMKHTGATYEEVQQIHFDGISFLEKKLCV